MYIRHFWDHLEFFFFQCFTLSLVYSYRLNNLLKPTRISYKLFKKKKKIPSIIYLGLIHSPFPGKWWRGAAYQNSLIHSFKFLFSFNPSGIQLTWSLDVTSEMATIESYQLYAYQENKSVPINSSLWKPIGRLDALPLPMACTLTQVSKLGT